MSYTRYFNLSLRGRFQTGEMTDSDLAELVADVRRTRCHHKGQFVAQMAVMGGIARAEIRRRAAMLPPAPAPASVADVMAWSECHDYLETAGEDSLQTIADYCATYAADTAADYTGCTGRPVADVAALAAHLVAHCMEYARGAEFCGGFVPAWLAAERKAAGPVGKPVAEFFHGGRTGPDEGFSVTVRPHAERFAVIRWDIDGTRYESSFTKREAAEYHARLSVIRAKNPTAPGTVCAAVAAHETGEAAGQRDIEPGALFRSAYAAAADAGFPHGSNRHRAFVAGYLGAMPAGGVLTDAAGRTVADAMTGER